MQGLLFDNFVRYASISSRRYLGNKYRLLQFIDSVISPYRDNIRSVADVFAGTGAVSSLFTDKQIITNDILYSNYLCHIAWFGGEAYSEPKIVELIQQYNQTDVEESNYMSENFSNTYFTERVCKKIGYIREDIESLFNAQKINFRERAFLAASLLYAMDKIANTCGHYDAYRQGVKNLAQLELKIPEITWANNPNNQCFNEDANALVRKIEPDLVYIDPPYNSRQYCDSYHVLENVACWKKPEVFGVARKMNRDALKSDYCTQRAPEAFNDLINNISSRYILVSYNNMGEEGDGRSNAKISDTEILDILASRGKVEVFSSKHKAFSAGKSNRPQNEERLFFVVVR